MLTGMLSGLDTLEIAKRLQSAGFAEAQAEALTAILRDAREADLSRLATRDDHALLRSEFAAFKSAMEADFAAFKSAMEADFAAFKSAMEADFAAFRNSLQAEFAAFKNSMEADFAAFRSSMQAEFAAFKNSMEAEFAAFRAQVKADNEILRRDLTIRLGGMIVIATGILLAAKFLG